MKLVQINSVCGRGSTGKICLAVSQLLCNKGIENYILYSRFHSDYDHAIKYQNEFYSKVQAFREKLLGTFGFESELSTRILVRQLQKIKPDIVHLHILHSHDCNLTLLFDYLRDNKIKVFWTFHDCWAMTAYCTHFDMIGCGKWKETCCGCPQLKSYSWFFDKSEKLHNNKKEMIKGVDLTIITPSNWMANIVNQSLFKNNQIITINNGINLDLFKRNNDNVFRNKYSIENEFIVLGVAFDWGKKKGLDCFCRLAQELPLGYRIVLVGTNDSIDKRLPTNIISIHRTTNQRELVDIYSAADLLFNPTRQDTFPTVNIEALACGTPVLTFDTGGSPEIIDDSCGSVIKKNDFLAAKSEIIRIAREQPYTKENCRKKAMQYDMRDKYNEYINLYIR